MTWRRELATGGQGCARPTRSGGWRVRVRLSCAFLLALALAPGPLGAAAGGLNLRLRADPDRVPADGKSAVVLVAEVVDAFGRPAPDGTPVHFVASLGRVVSPVQTLGGLAQTVLTASSAAGSAVVSAVVGGARQSIQVEFLAQPGSGSPGAQLIELTADEIAYSAEQQIFVATWQAVLKFQGIEIRADGIQYDMGRSVVCAQGNVVLRSGDRALPADALRYEPLSLRGRLLRLSAEPERLVVEGNALQSRPDTSEEGPLWEPLRTDETRTWVRARRALISPGERIVLDHATFYVDNTRVMSLRRHVLDPATGGAVFGQALGFSSASGVSLDLPMYYRASAHHIGSLRLGRNRTLGGYQGSGWSVGLREEYLREGQGEGSFELDDVLRPDLGLRWEHRHQLGGGASVNAEASAVRFTEAGPRLRSTSVSFFRPVGGNRVSLLLSQSQYGRSAQSLNELEYRFRSSGAQGGMMVTPAVHLRQSRTRSEMVGLVFDPDTGEPLEMAQESGGSSTSPGVDVNFSLPARDLGRELRLSAGLSTGYAWNVAGRSGGLLDGRVMLDRRFGPASFASLGFSYSSGLAGVGTSFFKSSRQLLSLSGYTTVKGTAVRLSFSEDLGGHRGFGSLFLARPLPLGRDALGRPLWSFELSHIFSRLDSYRATSTRLALARALGRYQAALCYSPQGVGQVSGQSWLSPFGYGYTYSGGRHIWLELRPR